MCFNTFYGKLAIVKVKLAENEVKLDFTEDFLVREYIVSIFINGVEVRKYIVLEDRIEEFIVGNLFSLGLIGDVEELKKISISENRVDIEVNYEVLRRIPILTITPSCGEQIVPEKNMLFKVRSNMKMRLKDVFEALKQMFKKAQVFAKTGGVHAASLFNIENSKTLIVVEDLGRHSAVDKVIGWGLLKHVDFSKVAITTTGRVFSDLVVKVARVGIPFIISKSAPSYDAVLKARKYGITLVGFARGNRFNVYSEPHRLIGLEKVMLR